MVLRSLVLLFSQAHFHYRPYYICFGISAFASLAITIVLCNYGFRLARREISTLVCTIIAFIPHSRTGRVGLLRHRRLHLLFLRVRSVPHSIARGNRPRCLRARPHRDVALPSTPLCRLLHLLRQTRQVRKVSSGRGSPCHLLRRPLCGRQQFSHHDERTKHSYCGRSPAPFHSVVPGISIISLSIYSIDTRTHITNG